MGRKRREESYLRDGGIDGGMPVLIHVRAEAQCQVSACEWACVTAVSQRQGGGREKAAANLTSGAV